MKPWKDWRVVLRAENYAVNFGRSKLIAGDFFWEHGIAYVDIAGPESVQEPAAKVLDGICSATGVDNHFTSLVSSSPSVKDFMF